VLLACFRLTITIATTTTIIIAMAGLFL